MALACSLLFAGCSSAHDATPHWAYEGDGGPPHWGELAAEYTICGSGIEQSPVDLTVTRNRAGDGLITAYARSPLRVVNNGHTIQFNHEPGSSLTVGGKQYELLQFHFHAPSEHTVEAAHHSLEFHLVHGSRDGQLAVIGVMVEEGTENEMFGRLIDHLPYERTSTVTTDDVLIDPAAMLPSTERFFHYTGSLTTPPCSESVEWFVLREPIELSRAQIAAFERAYFGNNRPVQPLNARTLYFK